MTVFGLTLAYWVGSGLLMATNDATDIHRVWFKEGGGPGAPLNDLATIAAPIPDPRGLALGISIALAAVPALPIASVDLRMVPQGERLQFADTRGDRGRLGRFYATTGLPMTAQVADEEADDGLRAWVAKRNTLKSWHRGNIVGLPGQIVGVITGLGLLLLAMTGIVLYSQVWTSRRRAHKGGFFWSGHESRWRRLHRWIAISAAVFIVNIAVSGTILAISEFQLNLFLEHGIGMPPYPRPTPNPPVSDAVLPRDINAMVQTVYDAARQQDAAGRIVSLQLVERDGIAKGLVTFGGAAVHTVAYNAVTGAAVADWGTSGFQAGNGYFGDWHQVVKRLHRGDIIGHFAGRYFDLAAGLALLYLVLSGWVMYLQMFVRRRNAGRTDWFWH